MIDLRQQLVDSVSGDEMWSHLEQLCRLDRTSGTEGEFEAVDYLVRTLTAYGLPVEVHSYRAYLSYPERGALTVRFGSESLEIAAKTRAFSASTGPEGVGGEIVSIRGGSNMFKADRAVEQISPETVGGKIVVSESGSRGTMLAAQAAGALGYVHLWPSDEDVIHEGIVTPVWGTPTPESVGRIPTIPVISIRHGDGVRLREALARERVTATLHSVTRTGWTTVRMPVTDIPGRERDFVLVAGHIDSWHFGATDNATGNVACLELARVLHRQRHHLQRGARIAWWVGHSTGRYSGSTWYADHHWQELDDHCVAYINVDSPGSLGASSYDVVTAVPETAAIVIEGVEAVTGQTPAIERPLRAGDQSFWGIGIPSLFMLLSNRPEGQRAAVGGCGMGWWWHTEDDTLDKADKGVLIRDTQIYAYTLARLLQDEILPLDLNAQLAELTAIVGDLADVAGEHFDLGEVGSALSDLGSEVAAIGRLEPTAVNRAIREVSHRLTVVSFTGGDRFDHDPAIPTPPLPALDGVRRLAGLDPDSDAYGFLATRLVRSHNAVLHQLKEAGRACRQARDDSISS